MAPVQPNPARCAGEKALVGKGSNVRKGQSMIGLFYLVTVARRSNIKNAVSVLNDELVD